MKQTLSFLFLIIFVNIAFSQDLIVTTDNDSINCKITKIDNTYIHFTFKQDNKALTTLIPLVKMKSHLYNYYSYTEAPTAKSPKLKDYPKFRISLGGGFSYRTAKVASTVPSELVDYMKKLKLGFNFYADGAGYFNRFIGLGGSCKWFRTSASMEGIFNVNGNMLHTGTISDNINILFVGPMFSARFLNKTKRHALHLNASIGYMGYWDDAILVYPYRIQGNTVGFVSEIGYDVRITDDLLIGFQLSAVSGVLSSYTQSSGYSSQKVYLETRQYESLHRLDITVGLRFSKMPKKFDSLPL